MIPTILLFEDDTSLWRIMQLRLDDGAPWSASLSRGSFLTSRYPGSRGSTCCGA